jgi:DNA-binding response OmpR family regulator
MASSTQKILVLDDDPDISTMLRLILEYKNYQVVTIHKPLEAFRFLEANKVQLVIMDMLLSGVNGTDLCSELKNTASIRDIPVLMMSAHPNAKEVCLQAGADDFIAKPFDMQDILSRVSQLIK